MTEKEQITALEFNHWLRQTVIDARKRGLSDTEIFLEVLNLARALTIEEIFTRNRVLAEEARRSRGCSNL